MAPRDRVRASPTKVLPSGWQMVRKKRVPKDVVRYCNLCRNHQDSPPPMRGHSCEFKNCQCDKCGIVRARRLNMSQQIRIRRAQDKQLGLKGVLPDATSATLITPLMVAIKCEQPTAQAMEDFGLVDRKNTSVYLCQRCKNHGEIAYKKKHKSRCPYASCECEYCALNGGRLAKELQTLKLEQQCTPPPASGRVSCPSISTSWGEFESTDSGFSSPPALRTNTAGATSPQQNGSVIQFVPPQIKVDPSESPVACSQPVEHEPNSSLLQHWANAGQQHAPLSALEEVLAKTLSALRLTVPGNSPLLDPTLWHLLSSPQVGPTVTVTGTSNGAVSYSTLYDSLTAQFALGLMREQNPPQV